MPETFLIPKSNNYEDGRIPMLVSSNGDGTYSFSAVARNTDKFGNSPLTTVLGEQITAEKTDYVNVMFQYNVSDYDVYKTNTGSASFTNSNAKAQLNTGTGVGKAVMTSKDVILYTTGHEVNAEMTQIFAPPQANTNQIAGIGNETDTLIAFGYKDLEFGIFMRTIDDGLFHIPQSQWNKNTYPELNHSAYNIYKFTYGWYGILPIKFYTFNPVNDEWILLHQYGEVNESENPHMANPTQPMINIIERTSGTGANMMLQTSSWRGGIVGKRATRTSLNRKFTIKTTKSTSAGGTPLISIRNKSTFHGKKNNVRIYIGTFTGISDGAQTVGFDIYSSGTLIGGTWTDREVNNSVTQYNNTATSFAPTGSPAHVDGGTGLAKIDRDRINLVEGDVVISVRPGEELHIVANGNSSVTHYLRVIEEF